MLIVSGTIEIKPEGTDAMRAAVKIVVAETLKEQGCQVYEFSQVVGAEHVFRVYEEWDDGAALKAHGASEHFAAFRATLAEVGVVSRAISMVKNVEKISLG